MIVDELVVEKYSPLVKSIVKRYIGKGVEYDDLYQLGCLGLVKAHNKFDPAYGVKFTTYAVPLIAGEIKRFLRDDGQIKVSRSVKSLYIKIKKYLALRKSDEVQPTADDLAAALDVTREEVIYAMEASHMPLSLFDKGDGDGLSLAERIPAEDNNANLVDNIVIHNMLRELEPREKKIILLRYFRNATQSEVAKRMGISQVQVSRVEQRVLDRFRAEFQKQVE